MSGSSDAGGGGAKTPGFIGCKWAGQNRPLFTRISLRDPPEPRPPSGATPRCAASGEMVFGICAAPAAPSALSEKCKAFPPGRCVSPRAMRQSFSRVSARDIRSPCRSSDSCQRIPRECRQRGGIVSMMWNLRVGRESTHGRGHRLNHSIFPDGITECYGMWQKIADPLPLCVRTMAKPRQSRPIRLQVVNDSPVP